MNQYLRIISLLFIFSLSKHKGQKSYNDALLICLNVLILSDIKCHIPGISIYCFNIRLMLAKYAQKWPRSLQAFVLCSHEVCGLIFNINPYFKSSIWNQQLRLESQMRLLTEHQDTADEVPNSFVTMSLFEAVFQCQVWLTPSFNSEMLWCLPFLLFVLLLAHFRYPRIQSVPMSLTCPNQQSCVIRFPALTQCLRCCYIAH